LEKTPGCGCQSRREGEGAEHHARAGGGGAAHKMGRRQRYRRYLKSGHWRRLRDQKREQVGRRCEWCGAWRYLEVHHVQYRNLYDVTLDDLACLCRDCHRLVHLPLDGRKKKSQKRKRKRARKIQLAYRKARRAQDQAHREVLKMEFGVSKMFREIRGMVP